MSKQNIVITEFAVQVFADGRIDWDGFDEFLWWRLHQKPKKGFEPHANKISKFGRPRKPIRKLRLRHS